MRQPSCLCIRQCSTEEADKNANQQIKTKVWIKWKGVEVHESYKMFIEKEDYSLGGD